MKSQSPPKQNMPQFTAAEMFFGMTVYTLVVLQSAYSVYKSSLGELFKVILPSRLKFSRDSILGLGRSSSWKMTKVVHILYNHKKLRDLSGLFPELFIP